MSCNHSSLELITDTSIRSRAANNALIAEQERHRHAKDELTKARSALQFVKTQVLVRLFLSRAIRVYVINVGAR